MKLFTIVLLLLTSARTVAAAGECPLPGLDETAEDCPWAGVARQLTAAADAGQAVEPLLAQLLPDLKSQLDDDARRSSWSGLWGKSSNSDAESGGTIVDPRIADALLSWAKAPPRRDLMVHAGIEHTYGYLFSTLRTRFGYKRARWVEGEIEAGLGLPPGLLGPGPTEGTLWQNVTYLAGRIAFRYDEAALATLVAGAPAGMEKRFRPFAFDAIKAQRLQETVSVGEARVVLRTDLIAFTHPTGRDSGNTHLLVYSVSDAREPSPQLVTLFPVSTRFVQNALSPKAIGNDRPVVTRYNAIVPGLTDARPPLTGTRSLH